MSVQSNLFKGSEGLAKPYSLGPYNKCDEAEQWIRISEGCPNNCPYCYEPTELKLFPIPEIVRNKVKIMDMNLIAKPEALRIIRDLGNKRVNGKVIYYELICGIDYRFMTQELAAALHANRFQHIRLAWDWGYQFQFKVFTVVGMLKKAGYRPNQIQVFMICNWKIPYEENLLKMDLCKVWGVQIADCWFDNQYGRVKLPIHWTEEQIKDFRGKCRRHNQLVNFGYDAEYEGKRIKKLSNNPKGGEGKSCWEVIQDER